MSGGKGLFVLFGLGLFAGWQLTKAGDRANKELERLKGLLRDIESFTKLVGQMEDFSEIGMMEPGKRAELLLKLRETRALLESIHAKAEGEMRSEAKGFYEQANALIEHVEELLDRHKESMAHVSIEAIDDRVAAELSKRRKVVQTARVPEEV